MANNYTEFSFTVPVETDEGMAEAKAWLQELEQYIAEHEDDDETYEKYGGVLIEVVEVGEVWFHDDGGEGNVEAAIYTTQSLLKALDLDIGVYFGWAETCSKPRINEFGGGGVVVTKDDSIIVISYDSCRKAEEAGVSVFGG